MKSVIVSAASRKLGKTLLVEALLREMSRRGVSASAYKLSRSPHEPPGIEPGPGRPGSGTHRMHDAGALATGLVRFDSLFALVDLLGEISPLGDAVIWESNAALEIMSPDCAVFISQPAGGGKKASLPSGMVLLDGPLDPGRAATAARQLVAAMLKGTCRTPGTGSTEPDGLEAKDVRRLLSAIASKGGIGHAACASGMSPAEARALLARASESAGVRLTVSRKGGAGGGRTILTPAGLALLRHGSSSSGTRRAAGRGGAR